MKPSRPSEDQHPTATHESRLAGISWRRVHVDRQQPDEAEKIIRHLKGFEPKVAAQLERETGLRIASVSVALPSSGAGACQAARHPVFCSVGLADAAGAALPIHDSPARVSCC